MRTPPGNSSGGSSGTLSPAAPVASGTSTQAPKRSARRPPGRLARAPGVPSRAVWWRSRTLRSADAPRPAAAGDCDKAEREAAAQITELAARRTERKARLSNRIVAAMGEFRRQYPVETSELNDSPDSADGYRELQKRLTHDDLPRFREQFK